LLIRLKSFFGVIRDSRVAWYYCRTKYAGTLTTPHQRRKEEQMPQNRKKEKQIEIGHG
jgi:hypothetical protein